MEENPQDEKPFNNASLFKVYLGNFLILHDNELFVQALFEHYYG